MVLKDANKGTNTIIISFCVIMSSFGILILSIYFLPWSLTAIPGVGQPLYPSPVSGGGSTVTTIHTLEFNYFALIDLVSTLQSDYSITPSNYVPDPHWVGGSALYPITEGDSISAGTTKLGIVAFELKGDQSSSIAIDIINSFNYTGLSTSNVNISTIKLITYPSGNLIYIWNNVNYGSVLYTPILSSGEYALQIYTTFGKFKAPKTPQVLRMFNISGQLTNPDLTGAITFNDFYFGINVIP